VQSASDRARSARVAWPTARVSACAVASYEPTLRLRARATIVPPRTTTPPNRLLAGGGARHRLLDRHGHELLVILLGHDAILPMASREPSGLYRAGTW
jgi:hypothetical protein